MFVTEQQFWHAILVLIKNYHALNKKIFQVLIEEVRKVQHGKTIELSNEAELEKCLSDKTRDLTGGGFQIVLKLLSKKLEQNIQANAFVDFDKLTYQCNFASATCKDFLVRLTDGSIEVLMLAECSDEGNRWADFVLKPKILRWCQGHQEDRNSGFKAKSLSLVDIEKYNDLYKALKEKHAKRLLNYWQEANESTDPLKFIYEDLSIAAYLITFWSCTHTEPTAFADLGCGNGLLVHILLTEGYKGYGFDIRKRKLWAHFPNNTYLIEQAVEPNSFCLPVGVDWLIGNHSDELSPWLPVLAARLNIKYFLLPCCPFELSGAKFQRRNTRISAYQDFYKYTSQLSDQCGFETLEDRLKIPSTKRLALIGVRLINKPIELEYLIREELLKYKIADGGEHETKVKLREKAEVVRNCTQVEKSIINLLVLKIFKMLLENEDLADNSQAWRLGRRLPLREIAQGFTKEELNGIKSECGGIKTLLRNKHEVFEFFESDLIAIRKPQGCTEILQRKGYTTKKRACFFKDHHPQGCPLSDDECSFIH